MQSCSVHTPCSVAAISLSPLRVNTFDGNHKRVHSHRVPIGSDFCLRAQLGQHNCVCINNCTEQTKQSSIISYSQDILHTYTILRTYNALSALILRNAYPDLTEIYTDDVEILLKWPQWPIPHKLWIIMLASCRRRWIIVVLTAWRSYSLAPRPCEIGRFRQMFGQDLEPPRGEQSNCCNIWLCRYQMIRSIYLQRRR